MLRDPSMRSINLLTKSNNAIMVLFTSCMDSFERWLEIEIVERMENWQFALLFD